MSDINANEALGWDDEATVESSNYTLLVPGTYSYRVSSFQRANFDGSNKMAPCPEADLTLTCSNAEGARSDVKVRLFLNRRQMWKITQFFKSCGLLAAELPDGTNYAMGPLWKQVLGCTGQVEISNRTYQDKTYNDVKSFVVPETSLLPKSPKSASKYGEDF